MSFNNHVASHAKVRSDAQEFSMAAQKLRAQGVDVIAMHLGQPSTGAPQKALEAAAKAMREDTLGYTSALGIQPLRERLAAQYQELYGVNIDSNRVIVTVGASIALMVTLMTCFEPGDTIALPYPVYPAYANTVQMLGLKGVGVSTRFDNHFQIDINALDAMAEKPKGIIIASPSNPAGSMLSQDALKAITNYCEKHQIRMISDEIYHGIEYNDDKPSQTALKFSDNCIVINSFSKYYSMPGWRVGWMVVPEALVDDIGCAIRNLYLSTTSISQYAALAALDCRQELDQHLVRYRHNRQLLLDGLPQAGFDRITPPDGAFYVYAHIEHLHQDAHQFCLDMINDVGIISMPGCDFDPIHGHHFLRLSYAGATEDVERALERLIAWRKQT